MRLIHPLASPNGVIRAGDGGRGVEDGRRDVYSFARHTPFITSLYLEEKTVSPRVSDRMSCSKQADQKMHRSAAPTNPLQFRQETVVPSSKIIRSIYIYSIQYIRRVSRNTYIYIILRIHINICFFLQFRFCLDRPGEAVIDN